MPDFKFELGVLLEDEITGFTGVAICRSQWLYNCNVYALQPKELHEGSPVPNRSFDEPQLIAIETPVPIHPTNDNGGPEKPVHRTNR